MQRQFYKNNKSDSQEFADKTKKGERTDTSSLSKMRVISRSAAEGLISKLNTEFEPNY